MSKTGVIIGRFQCPYLHEGHRYFINNVKKKCDILVILVGIAPIAYTNRNPFPYYITYDMLSESYPEAIIRSVDDSPSSDKDWSKHIDDILEDYENIILYGSRDSFLQHYVGKHKTKEIAAKGEFSASYIREEIGKTYLPEWNNESFRKGIIHTIENRFPTAYPTIDVALLRLIEITSDIKGINKKYELLLGRKPNKTKWCFIGGFVDPSDSSLFAAAARELKEEAGDILTHEFFFISSHKIDDNRYKGTKDGIITTLVGTYIMGGNPVAGDDIEEVEWFDVDEFDMNVLSEHHHILFNSLKKYLNK